MSRRIRIEIGELTFTATLLDTSVADAVWSALPLEVRYNTWGDEIYFDTGFEVPPAPGRETVEFGDVGYWPPGRAMCLFYGPTPMSGPGEIRPASPVAVFGRLEGDAGALRNARGGRLRVSRVE